LWALDLDFGSLRRQAKEPQAVIVGARVSDLQLLDQRGRECMADAGDDRIDVSRFSHKLALALNYFFAFLVPFFPVYGLTFPWVDQLSASVLLA
jgi:hypothetical protein